MFPQLRFLLGLLLLLALPVQGFAGVAVRLCGTAQAHDPAAHSATSRLAATSHTGHAHPAATPHAVLAQAEPHAASPAAAAPTTHSPLSTPLPCCDDTPSCGACCPALSLFGLPALPTLAWTHAWHRPTERTPPSAFVPPQHRPPTA